MKSPAQQARDYTQKAYDILNKIFMDDKETLLQEELRPILTHLGKALYELEGAIIEHNIENLTAAGLNKRNKGIQEKG